MPHAFIWKTDVSGWVLIRLNIFPSCYTEKGNIALDRNLLTGYSKFVLKIIPNPCKIPGISGTTPLRRQLFDIKSIIGKSTTIQPGNNLALT